MRWKALVALMVLVVLFVLAGCSNYNRPPFKPEAVHPKDGEKRLPFDITLSWRGGDPDGDLVTYTVYLGQSDLEPVGETTDTTLTAHLRSYGDYSWKVVAKDPYGNVSESGVWTFSTVAPPKPTTDEVIVFGNDGIDIADVSNPLKPVLRKTVSMPGITFEYSGEDLYAAGCGWLAKLDKSDFHEVWKVEVPGCVRDITVDGYVFLSMGKYGVEYLDPSSPTISGVVEEYAEGMDSAFDKVYLAAGGGGLYEMDASTLKIDVIESGKWVSDVKWSGNSLYFLSGSGVGVVGGGVFDLENPKSFDVNGYNVYALSGDVLHILDFSDRSSPTEVSSITLSGAEDIKVIGNYLYAVGSGFYAVDVSNPRRPVIAGYNSSINGSRFGQN